MNAIPSDARAPRSGCSGRVNAREVATTMGPRIARVLARRLAYVRGDLRPGRDGSIGGTRPAKKAGRGVPVAWLTAQGRVGVYSRHVAPHLVSHPLLQARTSARIRAEIPVRASLAVSRPGRSVRTRPDAMRFKAQPLSRLPLLNRAGCAKLVAARSRRYAPVQAQIPGKGVLAA